MAWWKFRKPKPDLQTQFVAAMQAEDLPRLRSLLGTNPGLATQVDEQGIFPLWYAVMEDKLALAKILLEAGASPNQTDRYGAHLLMYCVQQGRLEMAELLLQHQADVNLRDNEGDSVLMYACGGTSVEMVRLLLDQGARISDRNFDGLTAFDKAHQPEILAVLEAHLQEKPQGPK
jgi:ankyrin repeat protein